MTMSDYSTCHHFASYSATKPQGSVDIVFNLLSTHMGIIDAVTMAASEVQAYNTLRSLVLVTAPSN